MRNYIFITLFVLSSCTSTENRIKTIIHNSYYGLSTIEKIGDLKILQEDIFSLPVHYSQLDKYYDINVKHEYKIVRHIYKLPESVNRMFYVIDYTKESVVEKSSNFDDFFSPISSEILNNNTSILDGENIMELMRY